MRPPQDPELIRQAKQQSWYMDFDDVNPQAREILENYSGIAPGDVVQHVKDIRERAIEIFIYPCIGMLKFLDSQLIRSPCYPEIEQRLLLLSGGGGGDQKYLEVGCCFAQELRFLLLSGVPPSNLYATDLDLSFAELGFELFRDADRLRNQCTFIAADILAPGPSTLDRLHGQMNIINASYFFHLFDWDDQIAIGKRLVGLLAPPVGGSGGKGGEALITGGQVGGESFEKRGWLGSDLYVHSARSWEQLWEEIGEATGTRWDVTSKRDPFAMSVTQQSQHYYIMRFVVRQVQTD